MKKKSKENFNSEKVLVVDRIRLLEEADLTRGEEL